MLHIDIPTLTQFKARAAIKGDNCVSLYGQDAAGTRAVAIFGLTSP